MRQRIMGRVRENPLSFLYFVLAFGAELVALWLYATDLGSSGIDVNRPVVAQAVGILGSTFLLAMLWTNLFDSPLKGTGGEDTASSSDGNHMTRPSARVRTIAVSVWIVVLVLALAQVVAALAGNRGVALPLGYAVGWLNLIAIIGGLVMRASAAGRRS